MSNDKATNEFAALRKLAEAATPGPWHIVYGDDRSYMCMTAVTADPQRKRNEGPFGDHEQLVAVTYHQTYPVVDTDIEDDCGDANSAYIAAANPATILRLLDALAAQPQAASVPEAEAPMTTYAARELLIDFMNEHFTDRTFHRYIRGEKTGTNLAGDFAWHMATALRRLAAAAPPSPQPVAESGAQNAAAIISILQAKVARMEEQQNGYRPDYLLNGTRFKLNFSPRGNVDVFHGYAKELQGQWVALVPASDDSHLAPAAALQPVAGLTDADIDLHLDAVLKASGSALKYFSTPFRIEAMRSAMGTAMRHGSHITGQAGATGESK